MAGSSFIGGNLADIGAASGKLAGAGVAASEAGGRARPPAPPPTPPGGARDGTPPAPLPRAARRRRPLVAGYRAPPGSGPRGGCGTLVEVAGGELTVDFVGERHVVGTDRTFTFGRAADLVIDDANPYLHRVVGRFAWHDRLWW